MNNSLNPYYRLAAIWLASDTFYSPPNDQISLEKILFVAETPPDFSISFQNVEQKITDFALYQAALFAIS